MENNLFSFGLASEWLQQQQINQPNIMRMLLLVVLLLIVQSHARKFGVTNHRNSIKSVYQKTQPLSDQQIIQKMFEGAFFQNKLQGPFVLKHCFTPDVAHQVVSYFNDIFPQAAKGSLVDLTMMVLQTKQFIEALPYSFLECLAFSDELSQLGYKYDIDYSSDPETLATKIIQYIALHYLVVHRWSQDLNTRWQQQDYFGVGYFLAVDGHKIQYWRPNS